MKRFLLPLICLLTVGAFAQLQSPDGTRASNAPAPTIEVWGTAEILTPPEKVQFQVSIETRDLNAKKSSTENDQRLEKLKATLANYAVDTASIRVDKVYSGRETRRNDVYEQVVRRGISFELKAPAEKQDLIASLIENNVADFRSATLKAKEPIKLREEARAQALRAAKEKAQTMCSVLGEDVGSVLTISEVRGTSWNSHTLSNTVSSNGAKSEAEKNGQISTKASVKVVFLLATK